MDSGIAPKKQTVGSNPTTPVDPRAESQPNIRSSEGLNVMCSRLDADKAAIKKTMTPDMNEDTFDAAKWGELFPTDPILVIGFGNALAVRSWGLRPDWAERPVINAKSEECASKQTFRPMLNNRCIVPATGYFEWRVEDGKKVKTRISIDGVLPMAGFVTPDACVILTCAPSQSLLHIHHRMPAILDDGALDAWLDPDADFANVRPLLKPSQRSFRIEDAAAPTRAAKPKLEPRQASLF
jgi:putative SOS response-associated peptidase YedK